jgi:hypothetical protein
MESNTPVSQGRFFMSAVPGIESASASAPSGARASSANAAGHDDEFQELVDFYFKESQAERMADIWLAEHHLTKKEFDALPPEKQAALRRQMQTDIANEIKRKAETKIAALS